MAILVLPSGELTQVSEHLDRLRGLVADVEALAAGRHPSPVVLSQAPILENWSLAVHPVPCLTGQFIGHPQIRDGRAGRTSDVWIHAPSMSYARTLSRWYRLGESAVPGTGDVR